jgi:hypothetical protein
MTEAAAMEIRCRLPPLRPVQGLDGALEVSPEDQSEVSLTTIVRARSSLLRSLMLWLPCLQRFQRASVVSFRHPSRTSRHQVDLSFDG